MMCLEMEEAIVRDQSGGKKAWDYNSDDSYIHMCVCVSVILW